MHWFWFKPMQEEIAAKKVELEGLNQEIQKGRAAERKLSQFREEVKRLELELAKLLQILPSKRNTEELIKRIETLTRQGDFTLKKFTPGEFVQKEFYAEWPIDIQVEGTYHNLALFFDRMSRFSRIVNVEDLKVNALGDVPGKSIAVAVRREDLHLHGRRAGQATATGDLRAGQPGRRQPGPNARPPEGAVAEGPGRRTGGRMRRLAPRPRAWSCCGAASLLAQSPAAAAGARCRRPQAVIAPVPESPGQSLIEQDESAMSGRAYSYDPAGRRDPFRSLLVREQSRGGAERPPGIAGIAIDDLVVHGIWKTRSGFVAQIRATDNKSYLIRAGDLLYDGEVMRVGPNEVSFRQNLNDPQSVKPFREVTKQLNATVKQ